MITDAGNKVIEIKAGDVLYRQGDECSTMFLLKSGKLELYIGKDTKKEYLLHTASSYGDSLGEMGLLQGEPRNATAVAVEDSVLIDIDSAHFESFIKAHPDLAIKMIMDLSLRFKNLTGEFDETKELLLKTLTDAEKRSLKGRLKRFADILLDIPEDVPPDLYMECYTRNHGNLV